VWRSPDGTCLALRYRAVIVPDRPEAHAPVTPPADIVQHDAAVLHQEREYVPPRPNRLTAREGRYELDGRPTLLRSVELQYFRVPAEQWAESIDKLRAAGCNAISSYIPWSWHEPERGSYDFTGRTDPQRNVVRFLELVRSAGLVFLARPGPFIYAEYQGFGYPAWLAEAAPEALCQRPNGKPAAASHYQLYSLRHQSYLKEVRRWYDAVAELVRPFLNDPVVAWQLDNETGMIYALRVGDVDFNPDTVARYREFLRERYRKPRIMSRKWGRRLRRFEAVQPASVTARHVEMSDWQVFFEHYVAGYLAELRAMVRDLGIDLPTYVNEPAEYLSPQHPRLKAQTADFYGYDVYSKLTGGPHTHDFPWAGSHHALRFQQFAADERPLTCWEMGTGWWDWRAKVSPAATLQVYAAGLAHGLKGYNLYAGQDGTDPGGFVFKIGGLLDESGAPTERLEIVARLQSFVARHEDELVASVEVRDPIAYLEYVPYARLTPETCFPVPVPGLIEPLRYFASFAMGGFHALLQTVGYNVPFVDLESSDPNPFAPYAAVVFPSCGFLEQEHYRTLERYVRRGGNLITFPEPVVRREDGEPLLSGVLWPHQPRRQRWLGRLRLIAHLIARWMVPYYLTIRWKTAKLSPGALHLSDLVEPALVGQSATLPGELLEMVASTAGSESGGENPPAEGPDSVSSEGMKGTNSASPAGVVRGDLRVTEFPEGGEVLLRKGGSTGPSVGYRVRVRGRNRRGRRVAQGTSALIGTIPGGAYVTSRYYALSEDERLALRRFAVQLLEPFVPRTIVPDETLEVETVARRAPSGGCFLFVINRLGAQRGALRLANRVALGLPEQGDLHAEPLFSAFGSTASLRREGGDALEVDLRADDVLVLRLR
ncbi:MAG TPA: beta-galactosidase, partial [Chloroflexota bacterium]|nr:beta-galactosidase [Chloroflexota bacterium]